MCVLPSSSFAGLKTTINLFLTIFTLYQHPLFLIQTREKEGDTGPGLLLQTNTLGSLPLLSQHDSCPLLPNHHLATHASPPGCPARSAWLAFQCDIYFICTGGCFFFSSWLRKQGSVGCAMPVTRNAARELPAWSCTLNTNT